MKSDATIKAQEKRLRAIKGIGPVSAHTLIARDYQEFRAWGSM
jgi:predicted flap endonuclease-1-like 5' DNA nuclease